MGSKKLFFSKKTLNITKAQGRSKSRSFKTLLTLDCHQHFVHCRTWKTTTCCGVFLTMSWRWRGSGGCGNQATIRQRVFSIGGARTIGTCSECRETRTYRMSWWSKSRAGTWCTRKTAWGPLSRSPQVATSCALGGIGEQVQHADVDGGDRAGQGGQIGQAGGWEAPETCSTTEDERRQRKGYSAKSRKEFKGKLGRGLGRRRFYCPRREGGGGGGARGRLQLLWDSILQK